MWQLQCGYYTNKSNNGNQTTWLNADDEGLHIRWLSQVTVRQAKGWGHAIPVEKTRRYEARNKDIPHAGWWEHKQLYPEKLGNVLGRMCRADVVEEHAPTNWSTELATVVDVYFSQGQKLLAEFHESKRAKKGAQDNTLYPSNSTIED